MKNVWIGTLLTLSIISSTNTLADYDGHFAVSIESLKASDNFQEEEPGLGENHYALSLSYGAVFSQYGLFNVGISYLHMDDDNRFKQRVRNLMSDDESTKSSDTNGFSLQAEIGAFKPFLESKKLSAGLLVGYRHYDIDRSIDNCSNCASDSLDTDASVYLKPFVAYKFSDNLTVSLSYNHYFADLGFDNSIGLNFRF